MTKVQKNYNENSEVEASLSKRSKTCLHKADADDTSVHGRQKWHCLSFIINYI